MTEIINLDIIGGPDKWGIISAFADRRNVEFKAGLHRFRGIISSIQHEDGSGKSFNIVLQTEKGDLRVYYHSERRRGNISSFKK